MVEKEFIPYQETLALKKLGFDEPCFATYHDVIKALLYQQAFRFFTEKFNLPSHIATYYQPDWEAYSHQYYFIQDKTEWNDMTHYKTYEEAELACLQKLIELCQKK